MGTQKIGVLLGSNVYILNRCALRKQCLYSGEYKHCFLKAHLKGEFRESKVRFNNIFDADSVAAPKFVTDHEDILSQKRKLAPVRCLHILCFFTADK
jgi:hypothetical protein